MTDVTTEAEARLRERLKNLTPNTKNLQRIAGEVKNVQSPALRAIMFDFILDAPSSSTLSNRIAMIAQENPGGEIFADDYFLDKFLGRFTFHEDDKGQSLPEGGDAAALASLIRRGLPGFPPAAIKKVMDIAIKFFPSRLFESGHSGANARNGAYARNAFTIVLRAFKSNENEAGQKYLKPLVGAVVTEFESFVRGELSPTKTVQEGAKNKRREQQVTKNIMSMIWTALEACPEKIFLDRVADAIIKAESPALLLSGVFAEDWPFGEDKTKEIITAALLRWNENNGSFTAPYEYLYPELYLKAPPGELREKCLDRVIDYARGSGYIRGLTLLGKKFLDGADSITYRRITQESKYREKLSGLKSPDFQDFERVLDGLIAVLKDTGHLTPIEWEQSCCCQQQDESKGGYRDYSDWGVFIDPLETPDRVLLEFGKRILDCRSACLEKGEEPPIPNTPDMLEKIFQALLECLEFPPFSYFPYFLGVSIFDDFATVFLHDDRSIDRLIDQVEKSGPANVAVKAIGYLAKDLKKRSEQAFKDGETLPPAIQGKREEQAGRLIAALVSALLTPQEVQGRQASVRELSNASPDAPTRQSLDNESVRQFAPLLARELSKTSPGTVGKIYSVLFDSDVPASLVSGPLLFSGELSGEAFNFLKEEFHKHLHFMVEAFLEGKTPLPDWFSGETFMRECVRFSDKLRKFSLYSTATQRFIDIAVSHLQDNPGNVSATELVAEFMSRCGGGVVKDIRNPKGNKKLTRAGWAGYKKIEESLDELESLLGNRLGGLSVKPLAECPDMSVSF